MEFMVITLLGDEIFRSDDDLVAYAYKNGHPREKDWELTVEIDYGKMTRKDYYYAYRFLKVMTTPGRSSAQPFAITQDLPQDQRERIHYFLRTRHNVQMI